MKVILYGRVSSEEQAKGDSVSINEQLSDMHALCQRNGWEIITEFVDSENYIATQPPKKGKVVNPSGERCDRPRFLEAIEVIKTGEADAIVCWRDDRLVRHPRVAVALEDALDIGDGRRKGKNKIQIIDATGTVVDRFTLSIKATVWREENKRRTERVQMGKIGTLKDGRWPGNYDRLGYIHRKELGRRVCVIELADDEEVQTIKNIYAWYDEGRSILWIRDNLIAEGVNQKGINKRLYDWTPAIIYSILRAKDYTREATWNFNDGTSYTIKIPQIITLEQWQRVQAQLDKNRLFATGNAAKGIYLLQGIAECGECGGKIGALRVHHAYKKLKNGEVKRYERKTPYYNYRCQKSLSVSLRKTHPKPTHFAGAALDWAVWRKVVDDGIKRPEYVREQIIARQQELRAQGDNVDGDIARARLKLAAIGEERAVYQRQLARKKISEAEFDARMDETEEAREYWQTTLNGLKELRDDRDRIEAGLRYARDLLAALQEKLPGIDQTPEELTTLPDDKQRGILKERQEIIRALVDKVIIYADGNVVQGVIDGSETCLTKQNDSAVPWSGSHFTTRRTGTVCCACVQNAAKPLA